MALTRRGLLAGGAAAVPLLAGAGEALGAARTDRELVAAAIDLEQRAAAAYDFAARSDAVRAELRRVAGHLRDHELQHADGLARALRDLGGSRPPAPREQAPPPVGPAFAPFAIRLENHLVAAYHGAIRQIRPGLRQPLASIMASEAQHLVVLRESLGRDPLPNVFETGAPTR